MTRPGTLLDAVIAPVGLLARTAVRWLPLVATLAVVATLPKVFVSLALPDAVAAMGGLQELDADLALSALGVLLVLYGLKLVIELLALMFAFVILADITAGRRSDIWAGLRRLASWKLQFAWLFAGLFEQLAISLWFLGGGLVLVPFGFVTTAAYEEGSGFAAFGRSMTLGLGANGDRPGLRVAIPVTIGFLAFFLVQSLVSVVSWVFAPSDASASLLALVTGGADVDLARLVPSYGGGDVVMDLLLAPVAMLPTVYMITVQQLGYHAAARAAAAPTP